MAITTRQVLTKPTLPTLGAAGSILVDPIFGSRILRLTDATTLPSSAGTSFHSPSAGYQSAWNTDGTKVFANSTAGQIIPYSFDPISMASARLPGGQEGGLILSQMSVGEAVFSASDPNVIYGGGFRPVDEACFKSYNFQTSVYTTLVGVRDLVPTVDDLGRTFMRGIMAGSPSPGIEILGFIFGGTGQDLDRYIAVWTAGNLAGVKVLDTLNSTLNGAAFGTTLGWRMHEAAMDASGRFIIITKASDPKTWLWDTQTNLVTHMTAGDPYHGGGHEAMGWQRACNSPNDADEMETRYRSLVGDPTGMTQLISPYPTPSEFGSATHLSWNNDQELAQQPIFIGPYRGNTALAWREWQDEIIAVTTTSVGGKVWRFCHHRSDANIEPPLDTNSFYHTPRTNVSRSGRFNLFTSNWDRSLGPETGATAPSHRQDAFIVETILASRAYRHRTQLR